jgi:phosphate transport system substrate-binding protein
MSKALSFILAAFFVIGSVAGAQAQARDSISIVGSSTVYPFATVVAEQFGRGTNFKTPKIESTGSGGGFKLFCNGVGVEHADITNSSRRMKKSELETCAQNGVREVVEVRIGYDGIVLANSRNAKQFEISRKDLFLALAKEVPNPKGGGQMVANPYRTWKEVNSSLPAAKIEVLGPPPTSGTRDAFLEMVMEEGAALVPEYKELKSKDSKAFTRAAHTIREDGAYIEAGENDNLIVQKLQANANALGIFGFSFLDQNMDMLHGSIIDGVEPTFENIASGKYPVSRPLFFYVKKAHVDVIPGMRQYLAEFTSEQAWGPDGYLTDKGMIPMPDAERAKVAKAVKELKTLSPNDL